MHPLQLIAKAKKFLFFLTLLLGLLLTSCGVAPAEKQVQNTGSDAVVSSAVAVVPSDSIQDLTLERVQSLFEQEGFEFRKIPPVNNTPTIRAQIGESVVELGGQNELSTILLTGAVRDGDSARRMGYLATVLLEATQSNWDAISWYNENWTKGIDALKQGLPDYRVTTEQNGQKLDMLVSAYEGGILVRLKIFVYP